MGTMLPQGFQLALLTLAAVSVDVHADPNQNTAPKKTPSNRTIEETAMRNDLLQDADHVNAGNTDFNLRQRQNKLPPTNEECDLCALFGSVCLENQICIPDLNTCQAKCVCEEDDKGCITKATTVEHQEASPGNLPLNSEFNNFGDCDCPPGYPCKHGECQCFSDHEGILDIFCQCPTNWKYREQGCFPPCTTGCKNRNCTVEDGVETCSCTCPPDYPCNHGECLCSPDSEGQFVDYFCACYPGWMDRRDESCIVQCNLDCVNGNCILENGDMKCSCIWGFEGEFCEKIVQPSTEPTCMPFWFSLSPLFYLKTICRFFWACYCFDVFLDVVIFSVLDENYWTTSPPPTQ